MSYQGWKILPKVGIISLTRGEYDYGYFVDPDNKEQVSAARRWAGIKSTQELTEKEYYITENKNFILTIISSAAGSSQGGKLSFWTVRIQKDNREWLTAINADQLCDLIRYNTFVDGVCQKTVSFASLKAKQSFLTENSEEYKAAMKDMQYKDTFRKQKKTSKHTIGKVYTTLTESDAYLWDYYQCYELVYRWRELEYIKKIEPIKFSYMQHVNPGTIASQKFLSPSTFRYMYGKEKLPARYQDDEFDFTYDITKEQLTQLEKEAKKAIKEDSRYLDLKGLIKSFDSNYTFDEETLKFLKNKGIKVVE